MASVFFLPVWNGESLAGIVMPFCPQSNEPVNITGFHILKVPVFKVSLYGGNLDCSTQIPGCKDNAVVQN